MKIGIVGPGAMGLLFAYFFYKANIDIVLLGKDQNAVAEIKKGVNVIIGEKSEEINIEIGNNPEIIKECRIIFLFVKTYDTESAVKGITDVINKDAVIVTLQNGIGNKEIIARYIPENQIIYGSSSFGATRLSKNTVRLGGIGANVVGGSSVESVKSVEDILKKAKLDPVITDDPDIAVWKKAIINAGINPIGALLEIPNGGIIANEYSKRIQEQIVREAVKAASANNIVLLYRLRLLLVPS